MGEAGRDGEPSATRLHLISMHTMRSTSALLIVALAVTACATPTVARPSTASLPSATSRVSTPTQSAKSHISCATVPLRVAWSGSTLTARNEGAPCLLDTQPLVHVPWGVADETQIKAPTRVLDRGNTIIQEYSVVSASTCPLSGSGPAHLTVNVAGGTYSLPMAPDRVHEIMDCLRARAAATIVKRRRMSEVRPNGVSSLPLSHNALFEATWNALSKTACPTTRIVAYALLGADPEDAPLLEDASAAAPKALVC